MNETAEPHIAIIIPACNEEACVAPVLEELLASVDRAKFVIAVGVNDSSDRTAEIARRYPVIVGETNARGYGHGCMAAIDAVTRRVRDVKTYVFFAADGASDPADISTLMNAYEAGHEMVLGGRTMLRSNWAAMTFPHVVANVALGLWCGVVGARWFTDLAPLRLIERRLFDAIAPQEMTFGWTIEAQVVAALRGARICEVSVRERRRIAGEQKVSGVTWRRTFSVGCRIFAAGWRARLRVARRIENKSKAVDAALVPQSQAVRS
jgi:glycosyltransferase involved in cell wall biosynthesis